MNKKRKSHISRRDFLRLAGLTSAGAILSACQPTATESAVPTEVSPATPMPEPGTKELNMLIHSSQQVEIFQTLGDRFEADTGISLNMIEVPFADLKTRLMSELLAETGTYDLAVIPAAMLFAATPFLEDTTSLYTDELLNIIPEGALEMAKGTDNVFRGMPFDLIGPANFYRTDIYEEKGLEPPRDWDEWLNVCKQTTIEADGDQPKVWGTLIEASAKAVQPAFKLISWFYQNGGALYDAAQKPTINLDANVEALQFISDMVNVHEVAPREAPEMTYEEVHNMFIQGRGSSAINWSYMTGMADGEDSKVKGNFDVAPWPGNVKEAVLIDSWSVVIPKDSKKIEAGMEFLPYVTTEEGQWDILRIESAFLIPSYFDPNDPKVLEVSPYLGAWIEQAPYSVAQPKWEQLDSINQSISVGMNAALTGAMTAKEALDQVQEEVEALV